MFAFKFFRLPSVQRRELLAATEFEPLPLHPAVERQLELLRNPGSAPRLVADTPLRLFVQILRGISDLLGEIVAWTSLNALLVLGAVLIAREVFQARASLLVSVALIVGYLVLKLLNATFDYLNFCRRLQIHRAIQVSLYRVINEKLIHLAPTGRDEFSKGQLKTLIGADVESIEDFLSASLQQWIPPLVSAIVIIPALWIVSGPAGLLALVSALLLLPCAIGSSALVERLQTRAQSEQDRLATNIGEWVKNIRLVRFLGWGRKIQEEVNAQMGRYILCAATRYAVLIIVWAFSISWSMVPLLVMFAYSSFRDTPLNLVEIFSSFWLLDYLTSQLQYIPYSLSLFGAALAGARRIIQLLSQPELEDSCTTGAGQVIPHGAHPIAVHLKEVSVVFDSVTALDHLSLSLSLLDRTAIVGSVGSGKTTLLEVLVGERPLSSGTIELEWSDGSRTSLWREDAYAKFRAGIAYSPQQPFLSNNSMRANIDLSGTRSLEDVQLAVMAAQLTDDLKLLPRGLQEEVGESGINLSGGQKQRVSLARAFLSNRPLLILDDPLSAVDSRTESLLMEQILERSQGLILVSHRLAELERCDRVLVLEGGNVVEDGAPADLAGNPHSHFRRFLKAVEEHEH